MRYFYYLPLISLYASDARADCNDETVKHNSGLHLDTISDVSAHLGPVTVASLNLTSVFDCLRNCTGFNESIEYQLGTIGVSVNAPLDMIGDISEQILDKCFTSNEYGLNQLDYLNFIDGDTSTFAPLAGSAVDHRIVRTNIGPGLDGDGWQVGVIMDLNNSSDRLQPMDND